MPPKANKRVLVTGASGFVGACLSRRLLASGAEVHVLLREQSNRWRLEEVLRRLVVHQVDLLDRELLQRVLVKVRPEIIFHCAIYGGLPSQELTSRIMQTNVLGTLNLLEGLMDVDYECLIHMGSSSEYGLKGRAMRENDPLEPVSVYGVSKAASTLLCQSMARRFGRPIVTLRLFSPFGCFEEPSRLIPSVIRQSLQGVAPQVTDGTAVRDFTFIEDAVDLSLLVGMARPVRPEVFNVGTGTQHSVREVVEKIVALIGSQVAPRWGSVPARGLEPQVWQADISKVHRAFGWSPRFTLEEGLRQTIEWQARRLATEAVGDLLAPAIAKKTVERK
jgi:nucleoside-diphosphate-sugar epimerase